MAASSTRVNSGVLMSRIAAAYTLRTAANSSPTPLPCRAEMKCSGAKSANCRRCSICCADQVALLRRDVVPLVDGEHQRPALLDDRAQQARVLLGDIVVRIHDGHHHVRGLDGLQRLDDAEFLDRLLDARAAPQARRCRSACSAHRRARRAPDGIARGAGLIECHHAILAQQPIDQRALAHVRAADDRDFDAARLPGRPAGSGVKPGERRLEQAKSRPDRARRRWACGSPSPSW